jgi:hypothetical protein
MNEPKRRGRPPKALVELPVIDPDKAKIGNFSGGVGVPVDMDKPIQFFPGMGASEIDAMLGAAVEAIPVVTETPYMAVCAAAQAYANRVWAGQSVDVPHAERIARVAKALAAQGLSMEGVKLP